MVDMRCFSLIKDACRCPVIFDAGHSVQLPGAAGSKIRGDPRHIPALASAAVAAGADAVFVETHPDPGRALSDAASMLELRQLGPLVARLLAIRDALRAEVETVDV